MWELKRKLLYAMAVIITIVACTIFLLRDFIFPAPTCFDNKKNGFELNVDCGGTCNLKCKEEVNPLSVVWAKAIRSGPGVYDLVALVSNTNLDNASPLVGFTFKLFGEQGEVILSLTGSTTMPLDGRFPLIVQNVPLPQAPSNVVVTLTEGDHFKVLESPTSPTVRIIENRYEAGAIPRVYTRLKNTKQLEINDLPVRVLLYDSNDNVYAVGQTIIPRLNKEEEKEIIFTWTEPFPLAPVKIRVYPIFNPFEAIAY